MTHNSQISSEKATAQLGSQPRRYWTGIRLAPKLPVLHVQLNSLEKNDIELFRKRKANLHQLPYSLGGMCYAFFEFIRIQEELARNFPPEHGTIRVLASDATDPLSYTLDAFLDHARRLANSVRYYLGARYQIELSKSMTGLIKELRQKPDLLPLKRNLIEQYWKDYGLKIKAYRDLLQHYAMLGSNCHVFIGSDGYPGLYFALPNNPEEKSVSTLSYENPTVHVFLYMRKVFYATVRFVNLLSFRLLDPSKPPNVASLGPNIRTWIGAAQQGVKVASVEAIDAELRQLCVELATIGQQNPTPSK